MKHVGEVTTRSAAFIGLACLLVLSFAILGDAISRSIASAPIFGLSDLVELTAPIIVASCFPIALMNRQNITIRFLGRALPARVGQGVEFFGQLVVMIVLIGIVYELGRYTGGLMKYSQHTWLLRIPIWPSWILATGLMAVCVPIQVVVLRETVCAIRDRVGFKAPEEELLEEASDNTLQA
jgi:TRAP-type C4-dicarboxylate transport system permease small subunit